MDDAEVGCDGGFTLVEVVVCVALLVVACAGALGILPALVRASQSGIIRDAATNVARTAIDRARAASAYYPTTGYQPTHAYALNATASYAVAVQVHRMWCNAAQPTTEVPMDVRLAYDATSDAVTASVGYPRNPCEPGVLDTLTLTGALAPSALAPGTVVTTRIDDPEQQ